MSYNKIYTIIVVFVVLALMWQSVTINADEGLIRAKRGFGCRGPFGSNRYECNRHCKSNRFRGGYCDSAGFRCKCYG
ncbi:defensin BmKDfsin3-like [Oppia nitens]|uniref:defensin BmKDfsin3-like n=1 Tax=Oppia nitens TaxID=1686743 RepID=UPI0023DCD891|nr:defensin BmKDfsin3-like [Oppia nitens]